MLDLLKNKEIIVLLFNMGTSFIFAIILLYIFYKFLPLLNHLSNVISGMDKTLNNFGNLLLSFITKIDKELKIRKRK